MESSNSVIESEEQARNWLELPPELMSMILLKVGAIEILFSAQNVCSSWRKICKDPLMWRVIDTHKYSSLVDRDRDFESICRRAVELSCGQLLAINIEHFGTDTLLQYITISSNQLRGIRMVDCYKISDEGFIEAVSKLQWLEHLELFECSFSVETLKTIGKCCPLLKLLKLNHEFWNGEWMPSDDEALAIAETMPNLHHLQIFGNCLSNKGLRAILNGCPCLESLDLRQCLDLDMRGQLGQRCARRIKNLHLPLDSIDGYQFSTIFGDYVSESEDDLSLLATEEEEEEEEEEDEVWDEDEEEEDEVYGFHDDYSFDDVYV